MIEAASKCLHLITGDTSLPTTLPGSMSARFRLGASLAAACQVSFDLFIVLSSVCLFVLLWIACNTLLRQVAGPQLILAMSCSLGAVSLQE